MLGAFVGVAVAGLIDGENVKTLRQHRNVAREVRPARGSGTAAVQQHHRLVVTDARFVVVQLQRAVDVYLDEPRGGLESQLFGCRHHTMVSPGGSPNSLLPKIT